MLGEVLWDFGSLRLSLPEAVRETLLLICFMLLIPLLANGSCLVDYAIGLKLEKEENMLCLPGSLVFEAKVEAASFNS